MTSEAIQPINAFDKPPPRLQFGPVEKQKISVPPAKPKYFTCIPIIVDGHRVGTLTKAKDNKWELTWAVNIIDTKLFTLSTEAWYLYPMPLRSAKGILLKHAEKIAAIVALRSIEQ